MAEAPANMIAVVTGGGRGLGQHVAVGLACRGMRVAIMARNRDELSTTVREIQGMDGTALAVDGDVGRPDDVRRLRDRVTSEWGSPSILINAAGMFGPIDLIRHGDVDHWVSTMTTNAIGPYLICRAFLGDMLDAGWGRIINFSSAATLHPPGPLNSAYATSKTALNHLTRHLAAEIDGTGVTANVIHPGEVKTAMWAEIREKATSCGALGKPLQQWAEDVEANGGDDPQRTLDLIVDLIEGPQSEVNGRFLWIEGGQQEPVPSWT